MDIGGAVDGAQLGSAYIQKPVMPTNSTATRAWLAKRFSNVRMRVTRSSSDSLLNSGNKDVVTVKTPPIHHTMPSTWMAKRMFNNMACSR